MATFADNSVANLFFHSPWRPKWSQLGALGKGLCIQLFRNRSVSSFTFRKIDINTSTVRGGWRFFILAREDHNV